MRLSERQTQRLYDGIAEGIIGLRIRNRQGRVNMHRLDDELADLQEAIFAEVKSRLNITTVLRPTEEKNG